MILVHAPAHRFGRLLILIVISLGITSRAEAVVEYNSEKLDQFQEEDLVEFQKNITREERKKQLLDAEEALRAMNALDKASAKVPQTASEETAESLTKDQIAELRQKLLGVQKKDRWRFGVDGDHSYNSNNNGATPRNEKGDHQWNLTGNVQYNFGGKKTDMGLELRGTKNWNLINSTNDTWQVEERLRSRRKFFKKTNVTANSRIARHNSKTLEIDSNKIRWDASNQMSTNYAFSPKLSLNLDAASQKRLFLQEAFDQDSGWQATANPSGFWNLTPKSRISFGYGAGANRNRLKAGNSNSSDFKIGYFGQVTRKSSASVDVSLSRQDSYKSDSVATTLTFGAGYIWQMRPKVQTTVQLTRGFSNTTSESVTGGTDDTAVVTKTDNYAVNDNLALSLNYRMASKITLSGSAGVSHTRTKNFTDDLKDAETRIFTFPFTTTIALNLTSWLSMNFRYNFSFKTGDEKADTSRVHTWTSAMSLIF